MWIVQGDGRLPQSASTRIRFSLHFRFLRRFRVFRFPIHFRRSRSRPVESERHRGANFRNPPQENSGRVLIAPDEPLPAGCHKNRLRLLMRDGIRLNGKSDALWRGLISTTHELTSLCHRGRPDVHPRSKCFSSGVERVPTKSQLDELVSVHQKRREDPERQRVKACTSSRHFYHY